MDREKVIEIIKDRGEIASAVGMHDWIAEAIADELIANGIGDITEWKHRADVAEEASCATCERRNKTADLSSTILCSWLGNKTMNKTDYCSYYLAEQFGKEE